jgi:spore coat polysaccharide biosynthesis protein SpsF (cytidylyltransferase family)
VSPAAVVIQARMGSTRLPGKSLATLRGLAVIDWVVRRSRMAHGVDEVVVATSTDTADDELADHVSANGWLVARGDPLDVLDRYVTALGQIDHDRIIRVTGDCPFVQPVLIDAALDLLANDVQYVATGHDRRFPRGFDCEAITRDALLAAHADATDPVEREHVTPFIARRPERFRAVALPSPRWAQRPEFRLTLDEADDLTMLRAVADGLDLEPEAIDGPTLMAFLDAHPEIVAINRHVRHNTAH